MRFHGRPETSGAPSHPDTTRFDARGTATGDSATLHVRGVYVEVQYGNGTLERQGAIGHSQSFTTRVQWERR